MKKVIAVLFLLFLFYGEFSYVDMEQYGVSTKQVEVKGEVVKPGVYETDRHALVKEILEQAGGVNQNADTSNLNLTLDVADHSVIVVRAKQEKQRISINSASQEELDTLSGIGPAVAQRIIAYRNDHPFRSLEELKNVKGIGDKMYAKIVDDITL